jgi:hypothetical protein
MTAKQLDLFQYLKNQTKAKDPAPMLALLGAVDGIKGKQFEISRALDGCADLLAGEPERKNFRFNQFVHKVGRAIKSELLKIDKAERVEVVRDVAMIQGWFDDGLTCLDEIQEFFG